MGSQDGFNLIALVPMRHESERVQGKNYRPLGGVPLYAHILTTLRSCPEVERVVVDTDSPVIRHGVEENFSDVELIERPESLRGNDVPMNDILMHDVSQAEARFYLQTHSTNPLLRAETISDAIAAFTSHYPGNDSLFAVTRIQARLWDTSGNPINHDPNVLLNTQDLEPVYLENSCFYLFERESFLARGNRIGATPKMYEVDIQEAIDIDDEQAFALAERLFAEKESGSL